MWKRLQGHVREKERRIGNPVLLETTYDEDQLRHIPNVSAAQNANYQPNAYTSPLILDPPTPEYHNDHRASEVPTVSSMYSQPSPELRYNYHSGNGRPSEDISPPSSPELDERYNDPNMPRRFRSMRDVSPVDEKRGRTDFTTRGTSNIPVLSKAPPGVRNEGNSNLSTQKFWGGKVAPNSKVRWDEYSGEPNNFGIPASVSPGAYARGSSTERRPMGYQVSVTGPETTGRKDATLAERVNRFGTKPAPAETNPREPWSRAVGRAEIVKPFKDQHSEKPPKFGRKTDPINDTLDEFDNSQYPLKPTVPLKVGNNSPPRISASPSSSSPANNQSKISTSNGPIITRNEVAPTTKFPLKPEDTQNSLASKESGSNSRFSWTTYNSSTTYQHSPPGSPPPPLPTAFSAALDSATSSMLDRKRPIPPSDRIPTRKPIGESTAKITQPKTRSSGPQSPRPDSTFSTSTQKALPRPPTEAAATDHIETLESQVEDLRVRRNNVYRLLKDLNSMAPANPMVTDFRSMRVVDHRRKEFEDELAEIKVEEHDIGLKLHRAYRKREALDPNNGSALWVRRVTR